ncbi:hypothetical protein [Vreelandella populi]|uniref:hypothetical protein n=1 Tax=Vreelandella populi TaxID=2498858 RepID=UPI000F8F10FD|nr:hypothetical protein [Halomonas populi]RUR38554.1 hypothetical protein ELY25_09330 [Halomonas populi]
MKHLLWQLFAGNVKATLIDENPYRKSKRPSNEIVRAKRIPRGIEARKPPAPRQPEKEIGALKEDHIGKAAQFEHATKAAIKEKRFDDAWRLLQEQQHYWLSHANSRYFTKSQTFELIASINEDMADIQRLEGRHDAALAHLMYAIAAGTKPPQSRTKKLSSYFHRCKFASTYTVERAEIELEMLKKDPIFGVVQEFVASLRNGTAPTGKE